MALLSVDYEGFMKWFYVERSRLEPCHIKLAGVMPGVWLYPGDLVCWLIWLCFVFATAGKSWTNCWNVIVRWTWSSAKWVKLSILHHSSLEDHVMNRPGSRKIPIINIRNDAKKKQLSHLRVQGQIKGRKCPGYSLELRSRSWIKISLTLDCS